MHILCDVMFASLASTNQVRDCPWLVEGIPPKIHKYYISLLCLHIYFQLSNHRNKHYAIWSVIERAITNLYQMITWIECLSLVVFHYYSVNCISASTCIAYNYSSPWTKYEIKTMSRNLMWCTLVKNSYVHSRALCINRSLYNTSERKKSMVNLNYQENLEVICNQSVVEAFAPWCCKLYGIYFGTSCT